MSVDTGVQIHIEDQVWDQQRALQNREFNFFDHLRKELRWGLDSNRPTCKYYISGHCPLGSLCPDKHSISQELRAVTRKDSIVCKHWLRGLCKKGDSCEFLHEYNLRKMPECWFFKQHGYCSNGEECLYTHIDPSTIVGDCPWYARGFCPLGPECRQRHVQVELCRKYLTGFCPDGSKCVLAHPKFEEPSELPRRKDPQEILDLCFKCGQRGHRAMQCGV